MKSVRIEVDNVLAKYFFADKETKDFVDFVLTRELEGAAFVKKQTGNGWDGKIRLFNRYTNTSPPGVVNYVVKKLEAIGVKVSLIDKRWKFPLSDDKIAPLVIKDKSKQIIPITYKDYQLDTIKKLAANGGGLVHIATNGGKSIIFAGLIKTLSEVGSFKSLVIVHKRELLKQSYELLALNLGKKNVGIISSDKMDIKNKQVVVAMVRTVFNRIKPKQKKITKLMMKTLPPEELAAKQKEFVMKYKMDLKLKDMMLAFLKSIQLVIVDEVHHATASTYKTLMRALSKCPFKVGLSGTIKKPGTVDGLVLKGMFGDVVKRITNADLIEKGVSLIPKIIMYKLGNRDLSHVVKQAEREYIAKRVEQGHSVKDGSAMKGISTYVFQQLYSEGVIYSDEQLETIVKLSKYFVNKGLQTLIVVNRRDTHGVEIHERLTLANVSNVLWTGVTKDRDAVLEKFKNKDVPVMVATSVVDEGLNIHTIDVIILAAGMKSDVQLLQRLGRGLRKGSSNDYLIVIDFFHKGHDILVKHSKKRLSLWMNEGLDVIAVDSIDGVKNFVNNLLS